MGILRINGTIVSYDKYAEHRSIGVVGSGHRGEIIGVYSFDPDQRLGARAQGRTNSDALVLELQSEQERIDTLLRDRYYLGDNGKILLTEENRISYQNARELFAHVLRALGPE